MRDISKELRRYGMTRETWLNLNARPNWVYDVAGSAIRYAAWLASRAGCEIPGGAVICVWEGATTSDWDGTQHTVRGKYSGKPHSARVRAVEWWRLEHAGGWNRAARRVELLLRIDIPHWDWVPSYVEDIES